LCRPGEKLNRDLIHIQFFMASVHAHAHVYAYA
jgi:hypothetical protein